MTTIADRVDSLRWDVRARMEAALDCFQRGDSAESATLQAGDSAVRRSCDDLESAVVERLVADRPPVEEVRRLVRIALAGADLAEAARAAHRIAEAAQEQHAQAAPRPTNAETSDLADIRRLGRQLAVILHPTRDHVPDADDLSCFQAVYERVFRSLVASMRRSPVSIGAHTVELRVCQSLQHAAAAAFQAAALATTQAPPQR